LIHCSEMLGGSASCHMQCTKGLQPWFVACERHPPFRPSFQEVLWAPEGLHVAVHAAPAPRQKSPLLTTPAAPPKRQLCRFPAGAPGRGAKKRAAGGAGELLQKPTWCWPSRHSQENRPLLAGPGPASSAVPGPAAFEGELARVLGEDAAALCRELGGKEWKARLAAAVDAAYSDHWRSNIREKLAKPTSAGASLMPAGYVGKVVHKTVQEFGTYDDDTAYPGVVVSYNADARPEVGSAVRPRCTAVHRRVHAAAGDHAPPRRPAR
jgi:hypothetical protein